MRARQMTRAALFAVLTLIGGFIRIPLGPIPFTLQTFFVFSAGLLLLPTEAFFAMLLHACLKWMLGGVAALLLPSFGFVIGFIPAATLLAYLTHSARTSQRQQALHLFVSSLLFYTVGFLYMLMIVRLHLGERTPVVTLFVSGILLFLPLDLLKAWLAIGVSRKLRPLLVKPV